MAWLPPVNLPDVGQQRDYAGQLHGMIANVGNAYYGAKRDKIGDAQWQQEQERLSTAQALAQSNADRNYALELRRFEAGEADAGQDYFAPQPIYNPDTEEWQLFMPNKGGGEGSMVELPDGYRYNPTTSNVDLGTGVQPMARGVPVGSPLQKDIAGQNRQEQIGDAGGKAAAALPMIEFASETLLGEIDTVLQDPNLPYLTGPAGGLLPSWSFTADPGGMMASQARISQIVKRSFLQAYEQLRGAGAITQQEGQAATAAMTTLETQTMSDEEYVRALHKYRSEVEKLLEVARMRARGELPPVDGGGQSGQPITTPGGNTFRRVGP